MIDFKTLIQGLDVGRKLLLFFAVVSVCVLVATLAYQLFWPSSLENLDCTARGDCVQPPIKIKPLKQGDRKADHPDLIRCTPGRCVE